MKLIVITLMLLVLSACADLSMYNQVPAPIGRSGEAPAYPDHQTPAEVKTYPIGDQQSDGNTDNSYSLPSKEPINDTNPAVVALLDGAYQQSESGQLDAAASKLERAVRISPRDARVWNALAKVRYQQKKYVLSISLSRKSNLLSANDKNLQRSNWFLMADCYDRLGNKNSAKQARVNANRLF